MFAFKDRAWLKHVLWQIILSVPQRSERGASMTLLGHRSPGPFLPSCLRLCFSHPSFLLAPPSKTIASHPNPQPFDRRVAFETPELNGWWKLGNTSISLNHWMCQGGVSQYGDEAWDPPPGCRALTLAIDKK